MTLNQLQYFLKIAETGNMGRAAQILHIAQPSLSVSLSNLEKELNITLFNRIGHKLQLSSDGEQFLVHVKRILHDVREAEIHMQSLSAVRNTNIRIGCIAPVLYDYLPGKVHSFLSEPGNQKLKVDFTTDNTSTLIANLRDGYYDYVICSASDERDLIQQELISEPYVLLCPPDSKVPETWEELLSLDLIGFHLRAAAHHEIHSMLTRNGIQPTYIHRAPDEESIAALVSHSFGYGICPQVGILKNYNLQIAALPQPNDDMVRRIYLTQLISRPPIGAAKHFLDFIKRDMSHINK